MDFESESPVSSQFQYVVGGWCALQNLPQQEVDVELTRNSFCLIPP